MELPPDQYLRIINRNGHFLLLSVSDDPIQFGKGAKDYQDFTASYSSVQIFAESVAFTGDLSSPGGISMSCHNIKLPSNVDVKIDTSGAKGAPQAKDVPGDEAKAGGNGQAIRFYVQNGSHDVWNHLRFVANGGRGGNAVVRGARTGDGGNGGSSIRVFQSCYTAVIYSAHGFLNQFDDEHSTNLPWTSDVGPHALIRAEASKFLLAVAALGTVPSEPRRRIENLHTALNADKCQVKDLVICVRFIRYELYQLGLEQSKAFRLTAANTGGDPGSGDRVRPIIGNRGQDGKDTWFFSPPDLDKIFPKTSYPTADSEIRKVTIAFVHPEQCTMLLDRARTLYYLGSPPARLKADSVLQRLVDRLSFVDSLAEKDPLYKVYGLEGVERLKSIKNAAKDCSLQLATGVGFNGRTDNWAPRLNYTSYKKTLDDALIDHKTFEDTYRAYHTALSANQKLKDTISAALTQSKKMISGLEENIQDLVHSLQDTERLIKSLGESVGNAQRALKGECDRLGRLIKNDFELSVPQLMSAFTTFAFSPNAGMGALQGVNLLYQSSEQVPDINGQPANKDYIIGKMKNIEATATSIKSSVDKDIDGEFKLDDPLGTRLLAAEEDMKKFLADYAHSTFKDCGEAVKTLFHEFVEAMQKRNDQIISYNMQLKRYASDKEHKKEYEAKRTELQDKDIDTDDPSLLSATAYMGDIYQASRARIMQFLDNLVRSLNFRMLTTYQVLDFTSGGGDVDKVLLTLTHNVLVDSRSRIEAKFGKEKEILGEDPAFFPTDFDDPEGKRLYLGESQLADLKENYTVAIKIPAMHKWDEDNPTQKTPFTGSCNIRIHRVRFGLTGLTIQEDADVKRANVIVHITHSGKETIVDRNNKDHTFDHDPLTANYSYVLTSDGEIKPESNGSWVSEKGSDYALPGLFPEYWVINLKNSETNVLDFDKVTEGYMDFCGTDYAFLDEE